MKERKIKRLGESNEKIQNVLNNIFLKGILQNKERNI